MLLFAMLMCGVVVLFVAAGYDAVRILFERGAFGPDATGRVFICVLIYLLGSPINIMRDVVYRYFYARGNTKSTIYNGVSASALNVVVSIILARFMGLYGVVLGTTVTAVFSFTSILIRMKKQYTFGGNFPFFVREMSKVAGATVLAICGCMLIKVISLPWPSLAVSVLAAVAGVLVFGVVLLAARSKVLQVELG
jgi:peptidoglycan biosynthesis protein MviN/MurJ (putative lipid II flippase)